MSAVDAVLAAAERISADGVMPLADLRADVQRVGGEWVVDLVPRALDVVGGGAEIHVDASSSAVTSVVSGQ